MKALVLAAGLGTRLRPYTLETPKALFTLNRRPLLDIAIRRLVAAGAETVVINTHHLHRQIEAFLQRQTYGAQVLTRHEPVILGTGGAIRNVADLLRDGPFMVVNSDIDTDIDLAAVYHYHLRHGHPATLVLWDDPAFNTVTVDARNRIRDFASSATPRIQGARRLTFTGIQVLDPCVIDCIEARIPAHSIDAFRTLQRQGRDIMGYIPDRGRWSDLGTPARYRRAARETIIRAAFRHQDGAAAEAIACAPIAGDGSDRTWWRLRCGPQTLILVDHGLRGGPPPGEADAFVNIGCHLYAQGVPVPRILAHDAFAGLVCLEDLGDCHLQTYVGRHTDQGELRAVYRALIDLLLHMWRVGREGFAPAWTYQTATYDRSVIVDKECRYFIEAFAQGVCGLPVVWEEVASDCHRLADGILAAGAAGLMHRDFQSRNIMVHNGAYRIIDFQGARLGPIQYDLASLLIDPYVDLPLALREELLDYATEPMAALTGAPAAAARRIYRLCALSRNLQMLGAFGYLTRKKNKPVFARYIPAALHSLRENLDRLDPARFPALNAAATMAARAAERPPAAETDHR
jgi:aminoglycoside/choline kinase family phosphotransferase/dTDP-glucose pyrophosphorylase